MSELAQFFDDAPGVNTGRIVPNEIDAPEGDYVLALGSQSHFVGTYAPGDFIQYEQSLEHIAASHVRALVFFRGTAWVPIVSGSGPFALTDGQSLVIEVDRSIQTAVFSVDDFLDIGNATAIEVATVLNRLDRISAYAEDGRVIVHYNEWGQQSEITVISDSGLGFHRYQWWFRYLCNDSDVVSRPVRSGDAHDFTDIAFPPALISGSGDYAFRLELRDQDGSYTHATSVPTPAVYIDDVRIESVLGISLINRYPEPEHVGFDVDGVLSIDITCAWDDVDPFATTITVTTSDGAVVAYKSGAFHADYDGAESSYKILAPHWHRVTLDRIEDFSSLDAVTIRVQAACVGGSTLDESYTFYVEDVDPPLLISAAFDNRLTVRLVWNETIDPTASDPSLYTITPQSLPAALPSITSVVVSGDVILLRLDRPITIGVDYRIDISNVNDIYGNDSGPVTAIIPAYTCSDNRRFNLLDMIPDINRYELDQLGDLEKFLRSLQDTLDTSLCEIDEWTRILDPDTAPERFVDSMLRDAANPFNFTLSLSEKRRLVRELVAIYRLKGTATGIITTIRFFTGITVSLVIYNTIDSWVLGISLLGDDTILGDGDISRIYSFDVISPVTLTPEQRERMLRVIDVMKPAHTHLLRLVEPEVPIPLIGWLLGQDLLGESTILGA